MNSVKVGGFDLLFDIKNDKATITGIEGMDSNLVVPKAVIFDGQKYAVTSIGKKALLGVNGLRHVLLPETVIEIGDWAFAHCIHLMSLTILNRQAAVGRGMLEGCVRLTNISFGYEGQDSLSYLLATVVNRLPAIYLLSSDEMGSTNWYRNYDSSLMQYLRESDYAGSDESALCGEEDISYDDIRSVDGELLGADASYILGVRKNKNYLCLLRLMYQDNLSLEYESILREYINSHTVSHANNTAWLTLRDDLYSDMAFLKLYLDITKPDSAEIELMLKDLANNHPEMKAQLLTYKGGGDRVESFFDDLLL